MQHKHFSKSVLKALAFGLILTGAVFCFTGSSKDVMAQEIDTTTVKAVAVSDTYKYDMNDTITVDGVVKVRVGEGNAYVDKSKVFMDGVSVAKLTTEYNIRVVADNNTLRFPDQQPVFDTTANRVMVPIRTIAETLGFNVLWDAATQTVTFKSDEVTAVMTINSKTLTINGVASQMNVAPIIYGGRTIVPVRFVAETFGCDVTWDATSKVVRIDTEGTGTVTGSDDTTVEEYYYTKDIDADGIPDWKDTYVAIPGNGTPLEQMLELVTDGM